MSVPEIKNSSPGINTVQTVGLNNMSPEDQNRLVNSVNKYVSLSAKLEVLQNQQNEIKKKNEHLFKCIIFVLKKAFFADEKKIKESISEDLLVKLKVVMQKQCLIVDELEMNSIILPYIINNRIDKVDLGAFKDEISENALLRFFEALPRTSLTKVIISKPLSETEYKAKTIALSQLAARGLVIT